MELISVILKKSQTFSVGISYGQDISRDKYGCDAEMKRFYRIDFQCVRCMVANKTSALQLILLILSTARGGHDGINDNDGCYRKRMLDDGVISVHGLL